MHEIKGNKQLANNLVQSHSDMMFAGVVAGNNAGRVWTDSLDNPVSALVWSEGLEAFQFMGSALNEEFNHNIKSLIEGIILPFLAAKNMDCFEFSFDEEAWVPLITKALSDKDIKADWQRVYKSKVGSQIDGVIELPNSYSLYRIDSGFVSSLENSKIVRNQEFLIDYIVQFWGTVDNFLSSGHGYVAVSEDEIVSFSLTSFLFDKTFSIGVETLEQHRRKGIAGKLTSILLKDLNEKGYNIWWDCMDSNIASQKTAECSGLVLDHKYKVYWFTF